MGRGGRSGSRCSGNRHVRVKSMESEDSDEDYVAEADEVDDQSEELDSLVGDASEEESLFEGEEEEDDEDGGQWRREVKPTAVKRSARARKGSARPRKNGIKRQNKRLKADDQSDELDSLVGDASEEESFFKGEEEEDEEDEGEWRREVKSKTLKRSARARKGSAKPRENGVKGQNKRRRADDQSDELDSLVGDASEEESLFKGEEEEDEDEEDEGEWRRVVKPTAVKGSARARRGSARPRKNGIKRPNKRRRVRGRTTLKKKTSIRSSRKGSAKAVRKAHTKKRKNSSSLRRRTKSDGDEDFGERGPTLRDRNKKKSAGRKKRVMAGSDSDVCSDPSDYEFTISEEEREQVREANKICRSLATNLRSSRRIQEDEVSYEPKKTPVKNVRKGKEKAEEKKNDVGKPVCGVCLTEEGKNTVRGTLNCCSHYFCFACIFEWSKVETRCPLCKQRFVSISKPGRCGRGFDLRDTVIPVPERDQVYQPSEEELRGFLNPYENVICTECHQGGDDALMLLCDLCDSPAHTYCVGLGREVPEGNWYCDGCRPAALGSSLSQIQDLTPYQRTITSADYENMAEIDLNVTIPETPISQGNGFLSSPRFSSGSLQAPSPVSGMGVSTVSGRRMIHRQIHQILYTRLSQFPPGADISALGNLIGRGVSGTQQQGTTTDVGPSHHAQYVDRLQENPSHSVQSRVSFPGRLSHMVGQIGQSSASSNALAHSQVHWSEPDRVNLGGDQSQISASEQLHPCTGRLSIGPEIGVSPPHNRHEEHADFVKQRVHTVVRSQLKSLSRDMSLSHNDYVEILRRSAHTIMAAYGMEVQRHDTYEAQPPTCSHHESRLANVETSPVNGCCLVCFEGFVKDIVKRFLEIIVQPHRFGFRH
ncbi:hypothetical protein BVRB_4g076600 [Beta vulgaris subsp. vulgaris]|nr:hypothetical protein BVRB_4g076600 [Beta vulgaris subsp. vulgaris]